MTTIFLLILALAAISLTLNVTDFLLRILLWIACAVFVLVALVKAWTHRDRA